VKKKVQSKKIGANRDRIGYREKITDKKGERKREKSKELWKRIKK